MIETAERLNNQAIILAADGSFNEALACFARAITNEQNNSLLWYNMALTYRDAGKLKEAEESLKKAHAISPYDPDILQELSLILYNQGKLDEALVYCQEGLMETPEDTHLWNTRGVILFNKGLYEDACDSFENAVIYNPYFYDALYNLRDTYQELNNTSGVSQCNIRLNEIKKSGDTL